MAQTIDIERIDDTTGGDKEFLAELVEIYLEDGQLRVNELGEALAAQDPDQLAKTAHKLKGSSANMGANDLMNLCQQLEALGRAGSLEGVSGILQEVQQEFVRVKKALIRIRDS